VFPFVPSAAIHGSSPNFVLLLARTPRVFFSIPAISCLLRRCALSIVDVVGGDVPYAAVRDGVGCGCNGFCSIVHGVACWLGASSAPR
jgi:hypothetical protein